MASQPSQQLEGSLPSLLEGSLSQAVSDDEALTQLCLAPEGTAGVTAGATPPAAGAASGSADAEAARPRPGLSRTGSSDALASSPHPGGLRRSELSADTIAASWSPQQPDPHSPVGQNYCRSSSYELRTLTANETAIALTHTGDRLWTVDGRSRLDRVMTVDGVAAGTIMGRYYNPHVDTTWYFTMPLNSLQLQGDPVLDPFPVRSPDRIHSRTRSPPLRRRDSDETVASSPAGGATGSGTAAPAAPLD